MFTDRLNLPIDSDRLTQQDQILSLSGMTWEDYEILTQEKTGYRVSYFDGAECARRQADDFKSSEPSGVITIVSPSLNHEKIAEIINGLIKTYCRKYDLLYFPMGSTTLKSPFTAGKEPDRSFSFEIEKAIPDLAIEVIFSSGSTADLVKYQYLGVSEVWFWQNNQIEFYHLTDSGYVEIETSFCLSDLSSEFLIDFINRGLTESPLTIEADFIKQLS